MDRLQMLAALLALLPLSAASPFWLSVELKHVEWREGCLTTALCSQPRFQVVEDLLPINERVAVNWPISEHFLKDSVRPFTSYWPTGRVEDISLSCQVVGTDRTYGFPRICDQTTSIPVFPEKDRQNSQEMLDALKADVNETSVYVRGKCFNATLILQKHTERCPWCPDPSDVAVIGQELSDGPATFSSSLFDSITQANHSIVHVGVLALAIIAVFSSACFALVLVLYLRQKRQSKDVLAKPRFYPYVPTKQGDSESRYDMPWEQTRPLTYWLSNKTESTVTSPLNSASSIGDQRPMLAESFYTRDGYQTYRQQPLLCPQTRLFHHISPNTSLRHDDSGLESV